MCLYFTQSIRHFYISYIRQKLVFPIDPRITCPYNKNLTIVTQSYTFQTAKTLLFSIRYNNVYVR